jgi:hypothetical protein
LGVGWIRHRLPSPNSASPGVRALTAVHADGDVQDTLARTPPPCAG